MRMILLITGMLAPIAAIGAPPPDLQADVQRLIAGSGAEVAVAVRTLDGRDELLIDPDKTFHAASTMKVPVMIEPSRSRSTTSSAASWTAAPTS
jgi:beta-lactamase class A